MHQQYDNKCAEVTHWFKKHICILWEFLIIFPGDSNLYCFALEAGFSLALSCVNLAPCYFKSDMNTF